jgi:hypothetical protein
MSNVNIINYDEMNDVQFAAHCKWIASIIKSEKTATSHLLAEAAKRIEANTQDELF